MCCEYRLLALLTAVGSSKGTPAANRASKEAAPEQASEVVAPEQVSEAVAPEQASEVVARGVNEMHPAAAHHAAPSCSPCCSLLLTMLQTRYTMLLPAAAAASFT